jgi:hypothetical protein
MMTACQILVEMAVLYEVGWRDGSLRREAKAQPQQEQEQSQSQWQERVFQQLSHGRHEPDESPAKLRVLPDAPHLGCTTLMQAERLEVYSPSK